MRLTVPAAMRIPTAAPSPEIEAKRLVPTIAERATTGMPRSMFRRDRSSATAKCTSTAAAQRHSQSSSRSVTAFDQGEARSTARPAILGSSSHRDAAHLAARLGRHKGDGITLYGDPCSPGWKKRLVRLLLETAAERRDPPRVEAEPVHPADVARVLDLEAAVHDDRDAPVHGDPGCLLVDHAELAPECTGVDRDGIPGDGRQRIGCAEDVHDVDRNRHVEETRVADLSEDLGLAGIDRDHPVPVTAEVVADEVARTQLVAGQPHDGDRARVVEHALDRQGILVSLEVGHLTWPNACSRS